MNGFGLVLEIFAALLSVFSLVLVYVAIRDCKESAFVPIYYFIGFSVASAGMTATSHVLGDLSTGGIIGSEIVQDLMMAYTSLFLFGALWQSYEASI
ncbi:hypothetical protein [Candidatus Nanohalococcus occultus]|uniref:Uncharacterized protein n=1 Tax=Candidatus Nanohalococcus occultus TaxID=2978047 RepID=A0ABY8CDJ3_9ARCH|nr:hypothetical protein SVXNc_0263 [Candidatus Nanohaloarchaeota archaeon SVXNc]